MAAVKRVFCGILIIYVRHMLIFCFRLLLFKVAGQNDPDKMILDKMIPAKMIPDKMIPAITKEVSPLCDKGLGFA